MRSNGEVRWGILGAATIARTEVGPAIVRNAESVVHAVGSRRPAAARDFAQQFGAQAAYESYEQVLEDPDVDVVYNPLPNHLHADWTIAALRAGKHVLCEKPLALTLEDAVRVAEEARRTGLLVQEAFMYRFHPRIAYVRKLLHEGAIGAVRLVRARYTFNLGQAGDVLSSTLEEDIRMQAELGGGALGDVGSYCINGLRLYAGREPVKLVSWPVYGSAGGSVETRVSAMLEFGDGAHGQLYCAIDTPGGGHVEIVGEKGCVELPQAFRLRAAGGPTSLRLTTDSEDTIRWFPFKNQYEAEIDHFVGALRGRHRLDNDMQDAIGSANVLGTIRRSWNEGAVEVPQTPSVGAPQWLAAAEAQASDGQRSAS